MAYAVCKKCEKEQYWKAGRGARLVDVRCENCGGEMSSKLVWEKKKVRDCQAEQTGL